MGFERDDEDPHRAVESNPKLTLAGRLDGSIGGRPVNVIAEHRGLTLEVSDLRTLVTLRCSWQFIVKPILEIMNRSDIRFMVRISWLGRLELFPRPHLFVRLMLPR